MITRFKTNLDDKMYLKKRQINERFQNVRGKIEMVYGTESKEEDMDCGCRVVGVE